ncbi:xanthine/uracil permease [Parageobacillus toebii NBRC 107807]|jgi:xanthine permease|uniref:Xanthine/uracil permease n=1 Tax=Parageobacillus toebii NBRC 107807 TaxID=1223503 RepID=A0AA89NLR0_9BACL|nr:xanthine/uracil permease [Parageobacillus toebii NBRC 107807]
MKPIQLASLGIQHVLAMYAGAIIVPLIVGGALQLTPEQLTYLVAIDLFTCGIATVPNLFAELPASVRAFCRFVPSNR